MNEEPLFSATTANCVCSFTDNKGKKYKKGQVLALELGRGKTELWKDKGLHNLKLYI